MAKLRQVTLKFTPSQSDDVIGYKLFVEPAPNPPDYDNSMFFDLGLPAVDPADGKVHVDLTALLQGNPAITDGTYNVAVVAEDDGNNLSAFAGVNDVPLDFVAPDAPTNVEVVRV